MTPELKTWTVLHQKTGSVIGRLWVHHLEASSYDEVDESFERSHPDHSIMGIYDRKFDLPEALNAYMDELDEIRLADEKNP